MNFIFVISHDSENKNVICSRLQAMMVWIFSSLIRSFFKSQFCHSEDDVEIHQIGLFPEVIAPSANTNIEAKKSQILMQNNPVINMFYYCMAGKDYEPNCNLSYRGYK